MKALKYGLNLKVLDGCLLGLPPKSGPEKGILVVETVLGREMDNNCDFC